MDMRTPTFSFTVQLHREWDEDEPRPEAGWHVRLPHQCDAWDIAGGYEGVPHAEAVAALTTFVEEAQTALSALKEERELRDDAW